MALRGMHAHVFVFWREYRGTESLQGEAKKGGQTISTLSLNCTSVLSSLSQKLLFDQRLEFSCFHNITLWRGWFNSWESNANWEFERLGLVMIWKYNKIVFFRFASTTISSIKKMLFFFQVTLSWRWCDRFWKEKNENRAVKFGLMPRSPTPPHTHT